MWRVLSLMKLNFFPIAALTALLFVFPLFSGEERPPGYSLKVATLGDSITWGFGLDNRAEDSWPSLLEVLSEGTFITENFGRNGATVTWAGDRPYIDSVQYIKALDYRPDVIIISLGTNDTKEVNRKNLDRFVRDYKALIRSVRDQVEPLAVFITYPPPLYENFWNMEPALIEQSIIPMIDTIARETGAIVIDLYHPLQGKEEYFSDGVHPDERGMDLIFQSVYRALVESLEKYIKN
jgi:lysophospholipase L1-like esterase